MEYTILILLLPFLSFLALGLGGKWMSHRTAGLIGTAALGVVAVLSYLTAGMYFSAPRLADGTYEALMPYNFKWLPFTESLSIDMGILLDPISVMMLVVISTVSLLVHIYSFGYMKGERGFQRYYAFLSLFTMSMLGLVVATNIFQMYLFWELVGADISPGRRIQAALPLIYFAASSNILFNGFAAASNTSCGTSTYGCIFQVLLRHALMSLSSYSDRTVCVRLNKISFQGSSAVTQRTHPFPCR